MNKLNIAINGFGRIGRAIAKINAKYKVFNLVLINDINPHVDNMAYLFKYDSTYGKFTGTVTSSANKIIINDQEIVCTSQLSNYKVLPEANTHKLIFESDVICALQSSTALESAIAKKRVIFPLFYQFHNSPYLNNFLWGKHIDLFDIANNKEHFKKLFYEIMDNPFVDSHTMDERIDLFETYFDSYHGVALDKYSNVIDSVVSAVQAK